MARKGKLAKKASNESVKRPLRIKKYEYVFFIVCEDEKTEPYYFDHFVNLLPEETLYLKPIGTGLDPKGVVERAIIERDKFVKDEKREVDFLWVVFDKDDADINESRIRRFNEALQIAEAQNFNTAYSNEVFELWLLLHLVDVASTPPIPRQQIYILLEQTIRQFANHEQFVYNHGSPDILEVIFVIGSEIDATNRAEALLSAHVKGVLAELCQQVLFEAMGFNPLFKDNTELIDDLFPIVSRRFPFDLQVLNRQINQLL
mgnify:CR=1 FL=1